MSVQGSAPPRKLFNIELPPRVAELLKIVEGRALRLVKEQRGEAADVSPIMGFTDDTGQPTICAAADAELSVEAISTEVVRLWYRGGRYEKNMPYAEMRHPANRRLCKRLYRIVENEVVLSETQSAGAAARRSIGERMQKRLIEPMTAGNYRVGEADPGRIREGSLDALEAAVAELDDKAQRRMGITVAEHDPGIARSFGLMLKVIEHNRPFENEERVKAAYYLAVPFLFDARKPSTSR